MKICGLISVTERKREGGGRGKRHRRRAVRRIYVLNNSRLSIIERSGSTVICMIVANLTIYGEKHRYVCSLYLNLARLRKIFRHAKISRRFVHARLPRNNVDVEKIHYFAETPHVEFRRDERPFLPLERIPRGIPSRESNLHETQSIKQD